ncbi:hypothetical protein V8G54_030370 [Vigna mungo]|uniref:Exostosin GT47 domain-containing protein n=1 Tax=Vigna mungo TaxID=3915 RepID=A0AAQ3MWY0_VIGMU
MKEKLLWSIKRDVVMWFCSTEIVELSERMSSGKWNCAWWISEEDLQTIKVAIFVVPLFVLTVFATVKNSHICRWSWDVNCHQTDTGSYVPSPPTFQTQLHQYNETGGFNVSKPSLYEPYVNETSEPHLLMGQTRKSNILEETEIGLAKARAAIREARNGNRTQDSDYVPIGPVYLNAKAFHRSYLEMEKRFKVFVYGEGEPRIFLNPPCKSIHSIEGNFMHAIERNDHFRTKDPEKAHVFFLPFSVATELRYGYERVSQDFSPQRNTVIDYVNVIAARYPYWNRSLGADHFTLACHDMCRGTSLSLPDPLKNSILVLCNANTVEGFKPAKDVSFPEINLKTGSTNSFIGGSSASKRSVLAFFAGEVQGAVIPVLLKHWENKDEDIQVQKYLEEGISYHEMMRKNKFCLCPSGSEVASARVVEAIYSGCVPVLISEHYVPPFSDVLNWKSFSVEVSVKDIPNLKEILKSISPRQYIRMQRRVKQIRRHFEVHSPPKRFDVFHMILHSVWLKRLNFKVHHDQNVLSE